MMSISVKTRISYAQNWIKSLIVLLGSYEISVKSSAAYVQVRVAVVWKIKLMVKRNGENAILKEHFNFIFRRPPSMSG